MTKEEEQNMAEVLHIGAQEVILMKESLSLFTLGLHSVVPQIHQEAVPLDLPQGIVPRNIPQIGHGKEAEKERKGKDLGHLQSLNQPQKVLFLKERFHQKLNKDEINMARLKGKILIRKVLKDQCHQFAK